MKTWMQHCRQNGLSRKTCRGSGPGFLARAAFSLIEILVVVGLLTIIILGLLLMFNQTQKAFTTGLTQVDVLEAGRTVTEIMGRELSQTTPTSANAINFYSQILPFTLTQPLPGATGAQRVNALSEVFFTTRENRTWTGIGYRVGSANTGMGTLYRFALQTNVYSGGPDGLAGLYQNFATAEIKDMNRIIDGVVHFTVRAYDTNGVWIHSDIGQNIIASTNNSPLAGEAWFYQFTNNAVPAFVEFELGVLEDRVLARAKSIPAGPARTQYLANQASRVHLFRMRVPVHNVDPAAYQ